MTLGVPELLIIAAVIFLLFGAAKLPGAARSLGRSMRIFKSEMDEMKKDSSGQSTAAEAAPAITTTPVTTTEQAQAQAAAQPKVAENAQSPVNKNDA